MKLKGEKMLTEKVIWKYELVPTDYQELKMPKGACVLTVQTQNNATCIWALVDPSAEKETRIIETFCTGQPICCAADRQRNYVGTYQIHGGAHVFHVFESK
jgi:hypothetical protein